MRYVVFEDRRDLKWVGGWIIKTSGWLKELLAELKKIVHPKGRKEMVVFMCSLIGNISTQDFAKC